MARWSPHFDRSDRERRERRALERERSGALSDEAAAFEAWLGDALKAANGARKTKTLRPDDVRDAVAAVAWPVPERLRMDPQDETIPWAWSRPMGPFRPRACTVALAARGRSHVTVGVAITEGWGPDAAWPSSFAGWVHRAIDRSFYGFDPERPYLSTEHHMAPPAIEAMTDDAVVGRRDPLRRDYPEQRAATLAWSLQDEPGRFRLTSEAAMEWSRDAADPLHPAYKSLARTTAEEAIHQTVHETGSRQPWAFVPEAKRHVERLVSELDLPEDEALPFAAWTLGPALFASMLARQSLDLRTGRDWTNAALELARLILPARAR